MTSTLDLWARSGHDWRRPVVMPALPAAGRLACATVLRMGDAERRERLAAAIRAAMRGRPASDVAARMDPPRSKETVARWARGETVPSALDVGPLAAALGVRPDLLVDPPEVPRYPLDDYLLDAGEPPRARGAGGGRPGGRTMRAAAPEGAGKGGSW